MSNAQPPLLRDLSAPTPESDTSILWSDARLLGFQPMDEVHKEFYETALRLVVCTDDTALAALDTFAAHARSHFGMEDEWMRSTDFPPRDCHIQEHASVLNTIEKIRTELTSGRAGAALVQDFGGYMFSWFPGHADYLDSALAAWMTKRETGGRPVVLRRNLFSS